MTLAHFVEWIVLPILAGALLLAVYRVLRGPSVPDRVVAVDLIGTLGISVICVWAIRTGSTATLDAALVIALVSFVATVGFAHYLERPR